MWEGVGDWTELQHIDPHSYGHQHFFPVLLGCSTGGLASLGAGFLYRILFPTRLIPNWLIGGLRFSSAGCWLSLPHLVSNWLNFLCTELYNCSTPAFFLWASQIALIQSIHGQHYTLLFLDRMHLLFTQGHFLFWQPSQVVGQYTTFSLIWYIPKLIVLITGWNMNAHIVKDRNNNKLCQHNSPNREYQADFSLEKKMLLCLKSKF